MIELRDVLPARSIARHAFGESRPRVAGMRLDENVDLVIAREERADLVGDGDGRYGVRGIACVQERGEKEEDNGYPHPPLAHEDHFTANWAVPESGMLNVQC